ncbi:MAG TPA: aminotransferase class III-fold pyridoxal phosphate-dependent enzyme, partial [Parvularculaceae bacterium]|nr:aminotransferase class III-fold pyridoxal phosphate-dependent enzyme [Parvularculaceae bacterium]
MKPNPNSMEARDLASVFHPATNLKQLQQSGPTYFERGAGIFVYDADGKDFIEGVAGLWCASLGHGVEEIADAAREEMTHYSFSHLFGGRTHRTAIELAEKIKELAPVPIGKVFFGCSGSDANDTQVKLLRYYNNALGRPKKKKIIARERAYHGVTVASGSLTGLPKFHALFDLPIDGIIRVAAPYPYRDAEAGEKEEDYAARLAADLEETILREGPETIAGFIAEPVMGVGGVLIPPAGYFERVRALCDEYEIILIDDEVICGFWRTGKCFGSEATGMTPDTMTIAKALSAAYAPISAVMVPDWLYEAMIEPSGELGTFAHGFT